MANSKVALLRYVRIARGWRRFRVYPIRRGRGWDERISPPEGAEILERGEFQLRWYRGGDAVYKGVGHDLQEALTARDNKIANLEAERAALAAGRRFLTAPVAWYSLTQSRSSSRKSALSKLLQSHHTGVSMASPSNAPIILCLNDHSTRLRFRQLVLEAKGHKVLLAFKFNPVDLVVADRLLGRAMGTGMAAALKRLRPHGPIVIPSGRQVCRRCARTFSPAAG